MNFQRNLMKLFCGNAGREFAKKIAQYLCIPLSFASVDTFSDGEISVSINESVRGVDVFVIQSTCEPVNDNLMELLIMIDALKRASAGRITAVIPYYGYARQDRKTKPREPITAKLVADLIQKAGADRVLTMDLHAEQIQGYFDIPVDHLHGAPILAEHFSQRDMKNFVAVAPDHGSVKRVREVAQRLNIPLAIVDKRRVKPGESEVMNIIGDVKDKNILLMDDIIDTAGTLVNAAESLRKLGAKEIYAFCSHAVFSGEAIKRINDSCIREVLILDSIPLAEEKRSEKIKSVSAAPLFAEAIDKIFYNESVSILFESGK